MIEKTMQLLVLISVFVSTVSSPNGEHEIPETVGSAREMPLIIGRYDPPPVNLSYGAENIRCQGDSSVPPFVEKGVRSFMEAVVKEDFLPDSIGPYNNISDIMPGIIDDIVDNWNDILKQNLSLFILLIIGATLAILMPLFAICYCCCCCKKKPTAKFKKMEFILSSIVTLIGLSFALAGSCFLIQAISAINAEVEDLPQDLKTMAQDGELYLDNVGTEIDFLLGNNFGETVRVFDQELEDVSERINELLDKIIAKIQLETIMNQLQNFITIYEGLHPIVANIKDMIAIQEQLLEKIVNSCDTPSVLDFCDDLKELEKILTTLDATPIKDIKIDSTNMESFKESLQEITQLLNNLSDGFVDEYLKEIKAQILEINGTLTEQKDNFLAILNDLNLFEGIVDDIDSFQSDFDPYLSAVNTSSLVFGSLLIVIISLFLVAIILGLFGLNKVSSNLIRFNVVIFLSLGILFMGLCVVLFLVGGVSRRMVCTTLESPSTSPIIDLIQQPMETYIKDVFSDMTETPLPEDFFDLDTFIDDVIRGMPIYPLLKLDYVYNITELKAWKTTFDIDNQVAIAQENVDKMLDDAIGQIDGVLGDQTLVDLQDQVVELDDKLNGVDWNAFMNKDTWTSLKETVEKINSLPLPDETMKDLANQFLEKFNQAREDIAQVIEDNAVSGLFDFSRIISENIELVKNANIYLKTDGKKEINDFFIDTVDGIISIIDSYVVYTVDYVEKSMANTRPLGNIYDALIVTFCDCLIDNLNSGMGGLGLAMLLTLSFLFGLGHIKSNLDGMDSNKAVIGKKKSLPRRTLMERKPQPPSVNEAYYNDGGKHYAGDGYKMHEHAPAYSEPRPQPWEQFQTPQAKWMQESQAAQERRNRPNMGGWRNSDKY